MKVMKVWLVSSRMRWWNSGLYGIHSFTSLAYEIIWIRLLTASLGMTLTAIGLVLTVFVAGLGFGAALLSWQARRNPLSRWGFIIIQGGLGLWGGLFPWLLERIDWVYIALAPPTESLGHQGLRLALSALILLPPSLLIGMVFPLLGEYAVRVRLGTPGQGVGQLYQAGLFWSGVGALMTTFWLIPVLGLTGASLFLAMLNILAALLSLWLFRDGFDSCSVGEQDFPPRDRNASSPRMLYSISPEQSKGRHADRSIAYGVCLTISALLGWSLFAVQVVATKYLWLIVDATVYAEGMVLSTTLFSMAIGATAFFVLRRGGLSAQHLVMGGLLLWFLTQLVWLLYAVYIAHLFEQLIHQMVWIRSSALRFFAAHGALAFVVLGGPAFAAGLLFPALCVLLPLRESVADPVGRLMGWHYLGSVGGAIGATFLLLPLLGMTSTLVFLSAILLGVLSIMLATATRQRPARILVWSGTVGLIALLCWLGKTRDLTFRTAAAGPQNQVVFHYEDGAGIVEVYEDRTGGHRTLLSSRLRQEGGDRPEDIRVQRLQGALPVLLHPEPRRVLVVGLGTGISLEANLRPAVEQLTCVELSAGVIQAASLFHKANRDILTHPRVALVHQDGRNFLKLTRARYDLIIQDLFFPYRSGVGTLYTREHYLRARNRLTKGGRMAQWIALNQVGNVELRSLIRTFSEIFPHTSLWLTGAYLLLYGGQEPLSIDWPTFQRRFNTALPVADADAADFLGMFIAEGESIRQWAASAPLNTDDNLFIEYQAPQAFAILNSVKLATENLQTLIPLQRAVTERVRSLTPQEQKRLEQVSKASRLLWQGIIALTQGETSQARIFYEQAYRLNPVNYQVRSFLERDLVTRGHQALLAGQLDNAEALLQRVLALNAQNFDARFDQALIAIQRGAYQEAVIQLQELLQEHPHVASLRFNIGVSLYQLGRYAEAADQFARVVAQEPTSVDAHFNLANSLAQLGHYHKAMQTYQQTLALDPDHQLARENLQAIRVWLVQRGTE